MLKTIHYTIQKLNSAEQYDQCRSVDWETKRSLPIEIMPKLFIYIQVEFMLREYEIRTSMVDVVWKIEYE